MSDVVIKAEDLGKKYVIGHNSAEKYATLRDSIARQVRNLGRSFADMVKGRPAVAGDEVEDFWALRGLDFEIRRGDVVGIIGRNGAGKSTLLKVLSRITEPTEGRITIRGRVASLLEVGTGFHPELTGRENVYLNGAILGMTRAEIRRKFDEIVAFAEIEKFLDTPVKRYSSGMYVRLAFAVAAHLEPEILIVDEVLAVGDAEFQKKCLGKMQGVSQTGRTVLFVSHQTDAILKLCKSALLLSGGRIQQQGDVSTVVETYQRQAATRARKEISKLGLIVEKCEFMSDGRKGSIDFEVTATRDCTINELAITMSTLGGLRVAVVDFRCAGQRMKMREGESIEFNVDLDPFMIVPGQYQLDLWTQTVDGEDDMLLDVVVVPDRIEANRLSLYPENINGAVKTVGNISLTKR